MRPYLLAHIWLNLDDVLTISEPLSHGTGYNEAGELAPLWRTYVTFKFGHEPQAFNIWTRAEFDDLVRSWKGEGVSR